MTRDEIRTRVLRALSEVAPEANPATLSDDLPAPGAVGHRLGGPPPLRHRAQPRIRRRRAGGGLPEAGDARRLRELLRRARGAGVERGASAGLVAAQLLHSRHPGPLCRLGWLWALLRSVSNPSEVMVEKAARRRQVTAGDQQVQAALDALTATFPSKEAWRRHVAGYPYHGCGHHHGCERVWKVVVPGQVGLDRALAPAGGLGARHPGVAALPASLTGACAPAAWPWLKAARSPPWAACARGPRQPSARGHRGCSRALRGSGPGCGAVPRGAGVPSAAGTSRCPAASP